MLFRFIKEIYSVHIASVYSALFFIDKNEYKSMYISRLKA